MARTPDDIMARKTPEIIELDAKEFEKLLERAKSESFDANDYQTIGTLVESYAHLIDLLHNKNTSLARLRKLLFGGSTEKTDAVVGAADEVPSEDAAQDNLPESTSNASEDDQRDTDPPKKKVKGHGRNGANTYTGGEKVNVPHESVQAGDNCPECVDGTLYQLSSPGVLVRITGRAPLYATVYELEKLRCNLCNKIFTAQAPEGIGNEKYDEATAAMIRLLKYGSGLPFNRIDRLQQNLEIPLPSSTQWEVVSGAAAVNDPAYRELMRQAAQGELLQNDDTTVKILEWMGQRGRRRTSEEGLAERPTNQDGSPRTGLYTTGIVSTCNGQQIALFFSGHQHAVKT